MNTKDRTQTYNPLKELILPESSREFINSLPNDILRINLYLAQNRFSYKDEDSGNRQKGNDKRNTVGYNKDGGYNKDKEKTLGKEKITDKENDKDSGNTKVKDKIRPLLYSCLEKECIEGNKCYNRKMEYILKQLQQRNKELTESFAAHLTYQVNFQYRLIPGEGSVTPYSSVVLLKLHPLYGVPYIPASTIKGNQRSCWRELCAASSVEEPDQAEKELFGESVPADNDGEGLIFFDSYPDKFTLTLDVTNPHYKDYYSGKSNPTNDQRLTPVMIICLENSHFKIPIACRNVDLWNREKSKIMEAFKLMIEIYGIGAKTSLGYGMGVINSILR